MRTPKVKQIGPPVGPSSPPDPPRKLTRREIQSTGTRSLIASQCRRHRGSGRFPHDLGAGRGNVCAVARERPQDAAISSHDRHGEARRASTPFTEQVTATLSLDTGPGGGASNAEGGAASARARRVNEPKPLTRARIPIPLKSVMSVS